MVTQADRLAGLPNDATQGAIDLTHFTMETLLFIPKILTSLGAFSTKPHS